MQKRRNLRIFYEVFFWNLYVRRVLPGKERCAGVDCFWVSSVRGTRRGVKCKYEVLMLIYNTYGIAIKAYAGGIV